MKNLKETASRIKKAVKNKENIVLFGDSDLDGVTSAIILKESIEYLGGKAKVYLSTREEWGYGLSEKAVLFMRKEVPALLISLDCGISNFQGARKAKEIGFELIIIDHHEPHDSLPEASLILDPKQKEDDYPFKRLANAGIALKVAQEILGKEFFELEKRFFELAALATVADMVPCKEDNKEIIDRGIPYLLSSQEIPFSVLRRYIDEKFVEKTVSLLNITEPEGKVNDCFLLLNMKEEKKAEKMVKKLIKNHKEREKEINRATREVLEKTTEEDIIVFEGARFSSSFAGSVASRVIKKTKKPVFLYCKGKKVVRGSVRVLSGQNSVKAMESCKDLLQVYGGHPAAAGFTIKVENLEKFKNCLINYFQ